MRLIDNWHRAWRMASMWCFVGTLIAALSWLLVALSTDGTYVTNLVDLLLLAALQLLGVAARVLRQPGLITALAHDLVGPLDDERQ